LQTSKVPQLCRRIEIPSIYFTEYTLKTRLQIARAEEKSALLRARRSVFEINQERRNQAAIKIADGLQCNGTPTYDSYQGLNRNSHLFFDSRLRVSAAIDSDSLERRLATLDDKRPLHLVFTGRLDPMKGVRHLPRIAHELRLLGVDFRLTICGDGTLTDRVAADIRGLGLQRQVIMRGVLDFDRELIPFVQAEADLFVSSHVQGDPSCTYIETFGCGVPMIGFGNEALAGMLRLGPVGWTVPMGDHQRIAEMIQTLDRDRDQIKRASRAARTLALDHTFELMMQRRVEHMRECAARAGK
jgi:glycosyltransferase involved in cell wall biosynthesis